METENKGNGASKELREEIKVFLIRVLDFPDLSPEDIDSSASLFEEEDGGLGIDSIDALEIAAALQREYGLRIDDQNIGRFVIRSVDTIADAVAKHLREVNH